MFWLRRVGGLGLSTFGEQISFRDLTFRQKSGVTLPEPGNVKLMASGGVFLRPAQAQLSGWLEGLSLPLNVGQFLVAEAESLLLLTTARIPDQLGPIQN